MRAVKNVMEWATSFLQRSPQPLGSRARTVAGALWGCQPESAPGHSARRSSEVRELDAGTDGAEDVADGAAQEQEGHDRNDRDEGEDQRVLRETLTFLVTPQRAEDRGEEGHGGPPPISHPSRV